jgi:hypothetical protein
MRRASAIDATHAAPESASTTRAWGGRGLGAAQVDLVLDEPAVDLGPVQDLEKQLKGQGGYYVGIGCWIGLTALSNQPRKADS